MGNLQFPTLARTGFHLVYGRVDFVELFNGSMWSAIQTKSEDYGRLIENAELAPERQSVDKEFGWKVAEEAWLKQERSHGRDEEEPTWYSPARSWKNLNLILGLIAA